MIEPPGLVVVVIQLPQQIDITVRVRPTHMPQQRRRLISTGVDLRPRCSDVLRVCRSSRSPRTTHDGHVNVLTPTLTVGQAANLRHYMVFHHNYRNPPFIVVM